MFITYYWVENWLKLMTACAEQLQPLAADGDARTAVEAELIKLRDALADSQAAAAAVQERGELQAELKRQRLQAEAERADHARQLTDNASAAEKRLGEQAATREAAQAEAEALRGKLTAASAEARQAQSDAKRLREDIQAVQARAEQAAKEAKGQSERLAEETAALRGERQAAVAQADALRAENERLAAEIAAKGGTAESLRLELGTIQEKLQAALRDAADARQAADAATPPVQDPPPAESRKTPKRVRKPSAAAAKAASSAGLALRFRKPADWAEPVHVHYWNTDPEVAEPVWPGTAMSDEGEGWWAHQIEGARTASLVFNDAAGHQTGNLHRDRSGSLASDGAWVDDA